MSSVREITLSPGESIKITCSSMPKNTNEDPTDWNTQMMGGKRNATRKASGGAKRGPNKYMKFANKIRPQVLKEHPELKSNIIAVARKIGEKWRALSEAEKSRL